MLFDGQENSSNEFSKAKIKAMTQLQQEKYGWHFTFLGADQDSFAEAQEMGIAAFAAASKPLNCKLSLGFGNATLLRNRFANNFIENLENPMLDGTIKKLLYKFEACIRSHQQSCLPVGKLIF